MGLGMLAGFMTGKPLGREMEEALLSLCTSTASLPSFLTIRGACPTGCMARSPLSLDLIFSISTTDTLELKKNSVSFLQPQSTDQCLSVLSAHWNFLGMFFKNVNAQVLSQTN